MNRLSKLFGFALLAALVILTLPAPSPAQIAVGVSIHIGPPPLPVYVQPPCPVAGYMWTPGYWAYGPDGYYWVPGTWVPAPSVGLLWTPGYWGWGGGGYLWHAGYWGPHVGFYGGINYGFGYGGVGFVGGEWRGGVFAYNTAVVRVNTTVIHNVYVNRTVVNNTVVNRVSYNGGSGGVVARPTQAEMVALHDHHVAATEMQMNHEHMASANRAFLASENHGNPAIAASARPGEFHSNVTAARSANFNNRPAVNNVNHTEMQRNDRPPANNNPRPNNTSTNNSRPQQGYNQNNNHPNNQPRPEQHESHPQERESHPEPHHPGR